MTTSISTTSATMPKRFLVSGRKVSRTEPALQLFKFSPRLETWDCKSLGNNKGNKVLCVEKPKSSYKTNSLPDSISLSLCLSLTDLSLSYLSPFSLFFLLVSLTRTFLSNLSSCSLTFCLSIVMTLKSFSLNIFRVSFSKTLYGNISFYFISYFFS